ncbi:MAG: arsenosugar biosynthesis radical SAM protein ArsS [Porticoccaceae bacterium]|nr:arsenosugar biosynthesis radical SAM protein ArsS [Porticoccaceae bacterium]
MQDTRPLLLDTAFPALLRNQLTTLQVNLGYLCNLSCTHCHVNAGPSRTELMDADTVDLVIEVLAARNIATLDLTGGAPEMNPHFRRLVVAARALGVEVIDRCNLTILLEPGYEDLPEFLAANKVVITASLPCYSEQNVAEQRGKGVFEQSVEALQQLNQLGYGKVDSDLELNLVYNPNGAFLPPDQVTLQREYQESLGKEYGIVFNDLFTITNMPISRFGAVLLAKGNYESYMGLLKDNFNADNLNGLMCRTMVSVDWQGNLYDCDFNQMLEFPMQSNLQPLAELIGSDRNTRHLRELLEHDLNASHITVGEHCYGCTAGAGSSCGGALDG